MDRETLDRIFEPYFTTKEKGEGTGLGLATVHGIIKDHGGSISAYSEPDKGTTFNVFFPLAPDSDHAEHGFAEKFAPMGDGTILLVDDETAITETVSEILSSLGYTVQSCNSGRDALDIFRSQPESFDVIITDKTMPQITGFDLACEAKKFRTDIPIILCTGFTEEADIRLAESCDINEILTKPILRDTIAQTLYKVLKNRPPRP